MPTVDIQANNTENVVRYVVVVQGTASPSSVSGGSFNPNDAIVTSEPFPADIVLVTGGVRLQGIDAFDYTGNIVHFQLYSHAGETATVRQDGAVVSPSTLVQPYQPPNGDSGDDTTNGGTDDGGGGFELSTGGMLLGLGVGAVLLKDQLAEDETQDDADVTESITG